MMNNFSLIFSEFLIQEKNKSEHHENAALDDVGFNFTNGMLIPSKYVKYSLLTIICNALTRTQDLSTTFLSRIPISRTLWSSVERKTSWRFSQKNPTEERSARMQNHRHSSYGIYSD